MPYSDVGWQAAQILTSDGERTWAPRQGGDGHLGEVTAASAASQEKLNVSRPGPAQAPVPGPCGAVGSGAEVSARDRGGRRADD